MAFQGPIDMKNPGLTLTCFEDYEEQGNAMRDRYDNDGMFLQVYFGKLPRLAKGRRDLS